jgi:hypothetical protein
MITHFDLGHANPMLDPKAENQLDTKLSQAKVL